jgi:hypothetical protein
MKKLVILVCLLILLLSVTAVYADDSYWESNGGGTTGRLELRSNPVKSDELNCPDLIWESCGQPPISNGAGLND